MQKIINFWGGSLRTNMLGFRTSKNANSQEMASPIEKRFNKHFQEYYLATFSW
jgi:hypothetical protein